MRSLVVLAAAIVLLATALRAPVIAAADVGTRDFSYGTSASAPTAEKPQSKLWFNDGSWWGILWSRQKGVYDIYRFDWSGDAWIDTGVAIDTRNRSRADALWDGSKLYVLSHQKEGTNGGDLGIKLLRYSYNASQRTYLLDSGFPFTIASASIEAGVIDKDTTGKLWVTYTLENSATTRAVYVAHSTTSDRAWTTPFVVPATGSANLTTDDISALVSYNGKIGVMWSNQTDGAMYFATHVDGAADGAWSQNPALQGPKYADDHINLKSLQADASGQVFAAVKTSLNDVLPSTSSEPLILLLILDGNGGWQRRTFGRVSDNHTRPMVLIDNENRQLYMFAVAPCCSGGTIYMKQTSLDNPSFTSGMGTPFISLASDPIMTNPTSTKQPVNRKSGILVLAADDHSKFYAHNRISLAPVDTTPPDTTIDQGPSGTVTSDSATFAFSATEPGSTFSCRLDGAAASGCTSPVSFTGLAAGGHTFTVAATDAAGNTDPTPASRSWTVDPVVPDTTPPTVSLTAPADGALVHGTVAVSANAQDDTIVDHVDFLVDGSVVATDVAPPYTYDWPTSGHADGTATLTARAVDIGGNEATSQPRTVTVDNTPPDTTIDSGPSGTVASDSGTFAFSASEPGSTFACSLDGATATACTSPKAFTGLANGSHTFTVAATDPAGNADPTPATRTWTANVPVADTTPPTAALTAPDDGARVGGTVRMAATAGDDVAVDRVEFLVDGAVVATDRDAPYAADWNAAGHAEGAATLAARAVDTSGNQATSATRTVTVDTTPPDTTISSGPSGTVAATDATFAFTSSEPGSAFACTLDGGSASACTSPVSYTGLADGSHTFGVAATDAAGNADPTPATQSWTVDATPPAAPVITSPVEGAQVGSRSFTVAGTAEPASIVSLREGTTGQGTATAAADGSWSVGLTNVPDGTHAYAATATDGVGNASTASAARTITVDTAAPDTTIDGGPSGTAVSATATFTFSATETGATFSCKLDGAPASGCTSPKTYVGLAEGVHTFSVSATDRAGNPDPTPASRSWTVDVSGGAMLFSDDFESGSLAAWTQVRTGGDGTGAAQGSVVKSGAWAALLTESAANGSFAYARKTLSVVRSDLIVTGDFQVTAEGASGGNVPLIRLFDAAGTRLVSLYRANGTGNRIEVNHSGLFVQTTGKLPLNTWGQLTLHVITGGTGASTVEVKLNGTLVYRTTAGSIAAPIAAVQIGNETARQAGSVVVDNLIVVNGLATADPGTGAVPRFDHIFVVVEENKRFDQVIGNPDAAYLNGLAMTGGLAQNYKPITHPSLPNYIAMIGGSTFGITTDCNPTGTGACPISAPNLADRIEAAGRTWRGYFDGMPLPCTTTSAGTYVPRHNPFVYFDDIRTDEPRCVDGVVPFTRFDDDLASVATTPDFALIVPDKCNDMHDCPIATGDDWLRTNLRTIFDSPAWKTQNSLLVITFDEDDEGTNTAGTVATVLVGPSVRAGVTSLAARDHYSLLRTIEDAWGLPTLTANDAGAKPLAELFTQ